MQVLRHFLVLRGMPGRCQISLRLLRPIDVREMCISLLRWKRGQTRGQETALRRLLEDGKRPVLQIHGVFGYLVRYVRDGRKYVLLLG